jgi:hypothetical protein
VAVLSQGNKNRKRQAFQVASRAGLKYIEGYSKAFFRKVKYPSLIGHSMHLRVGRDKAEKVQ